MLGFEPKKEFIGYVPVELNKPPAGAGVVVLAKAPPKGLGAPNKPVLCELLVFAIALAPKSELVGAGAGFGAADEGMKTAFAR